MIGTAALLATMALTGSAQPGAHFSAPFKVHYAAPAFGATP
jgi:hypothetical protein